MVSKVLDNMGVIVRVGTMMYNAVVHTVLLYGSKIWVIMEAMMKVLEEFRHSIARRIMRNMDW